MTFETALRLLTSLAMVAPLFGLWWTFRGSSGHPSDNPAESVK